jgi:1,4-dihydroxy-2-naphthoate octaprenyltransferase
MNARIPEDTLAPVSGAGVRPGSARAWLLAARPRTLPVGLAPVLVGAAVAAEEGPVDGWAIVAAFLGSLWIQIGANFANDLGDAEKGADTGERTGPVRAAASGLLTRAQVRAGMLGSFVLATLAGIYLMAVGGWPIVVIGVASILSAMAYTGGPWPLGYHGLGDLFVFLFYGLVAVGGTAYVAAGHLPPMALAGGAAVGALATCVLVVNNVRDRVTDAKVGKRTLVARFGRAFGVREYAALLALAYAVPLALALSGHGSPWLLLPLVSLFRALKLLKLLATLEGPPLNGVLAGTGQLTFGYAFLFAGGLLL